MFAISKPVLVRWELEDTWGLIVGYMRAIR